MLNFVIYIIYIQTFSVPKSRKSSKSRFVKGIPGKPYKIAKPLCSVSNLYIAFVEKNKKNGRGPPFPSNTLLNHLLSTTLESGSEAAKENALKGLTVY